MTGLFTEEYPLSLPRESLELLLHYVLPYMHELLKNYSRSICSGPLKMCSKVTGLTESASRLKQSLYTNKEFLLVSWFKYRGTEREVNRQFYGQVMPS